MNVARGDRRVKEAWRRGVTVEHHSEPSRQAALVARVEALLIDRADHLPLVILALTPGEAHDNRLWSVLLGALLPETMLLADRGYDADWIRELGPPARGVGKHFRRNATAKPYLL